MNEKDEKIAVQLSRADTAKKLLDNDLFRNSVIAVKAHLVSTIESSKWPQKRLREESYRQLKSLNSVLRIIEKEIETGKLAARHIKGNKS